MSISSKYAAISITYPYQVVRSRIQVCHCFTTSVVPHDLSPSFPAILERFTSTSIPYDTGHHQADMGRGRCKGILSWFGHKLRTRSAWNLCNLRRLRESGVASEIICCEEGLCLTRKRLPSIGNPSIRIIPV